jgi:hypothetical protein
MFALVFVLNASCFYWRFCCSSMHSTRGTEWNNECGRRERDHDQSFGVRMRTNVTCCELFRVMTLSAPAHPFKTLQAVCALGAAAASHIANTTGHVRVKTQVIKPVLFSALFKKYDCLKPWGLNRQSNLQILNLCLDSRVLTARYLRAQPSEIWALLKFQF